jgi:PAS domain S-box-containing protein
MRGPSERPVAAVDDTAGVRGPIRVLHVDDDDAYAELVSTFLERADDRIDVVTATSATAGLEVLDEGGIDCVVSDHDMPGRDGIEFLEAVREDHPDLPFILFTGKGSEEIASLAISAGVDDYLQKGRGTEQYTLLANRVVNYVGRARERTQRQRLLAAIETTRDGVALLDTDGEYVYVNEAYGDLYGVDPADVVGQHWTDVFPDEEGSFLDEVVRPALETDGFWEGESTVKRADGSTFVAERTATATGTDEFVWSVRDVTDRKERERALTETNRQLEGVLDTVEAAIFMKDTEGQYLLMNQNCRDLIGLEEGERAVGKTDYDLVPAEMADRYRADDRQVLASGETLVVEEPVPTPEGVRTYLTRKSPVVDEEGDPYAICAVSTDITERKERERELELTTELLSSTERMGDVGSWELDVERRTVTWTEGTRRILGVAETFDPTLEEGLAFVVPEERERIASLVERCIERGEPFETETRVVTRDGDQCWVAVRGETRETAADTRVVRGYLQDITRRKQREEQLVAARERLDTVVSNVPVVLFALDAEGTFTLSEGKGLEPLGLASGEVVGESVFDVYGWHDDIVAAADRALDGEPIEEVYSMDDIVFETTFQPVFDDEGDLERVIGVAVDVTKFDVAGDD